MAEPTEPLLASTLLASHQAREASKPQSTRGRLATRCRSIDTALESGLEYGSLTCLNGEADSSVREVSQALLVSHLLNSSGSAATIIDTGSSFNVRSLYRTLSMETQGESGAAERIWKILDRVKIMKVFDFVGLMDSVAECRDEMEGKGKVPNTEVQPPKATIGDSEDEGEDEMLDTVSTPRKSEPAASNVQREERADCRLLIIGQIDQCAGPLLKNNYVQGQALLISFMRSLAHLTKAHHLCTLLLNDVLSKSDPREESPSIFSSCKLQPALGKAFTYMLDTSLLIHRMPRAGSEGRRSHGADEHTVAQARGEDLVSIIEVLQDRYGGRVGKWAAFTVDDAEMLKSLS